MKLTELIPSLRDLNQIGRFYRGTPASTIRIQPKASYQRNPSCTAVPPKKNILNFIPSRCRACGEARFCIGASLNLKAVFSSFTGRHEA